MSGIDPASACGGAGGCVWGQRSAGLPFGGLCFVVVTSWLAMANFFTRALLLDHAAGAFGSAAVLRPAGSPLMPLRRMLQQPDLARRWVRKSWTANPRATTIFAAEGVDWLLQRGQGGARRAEDTSEAVHPGSLGVQDLPSRLGVQDLPGCLVVQNHLHQTRLRHPQKTKQLS